MLSFIFNLVYEYVLLFSLDKYNNENINVTIDDLTFIHIAYTGMCFFAKSHLVYEL